MTDVVRIRRPGPPARAAVNAVNAVNTVNAVITVIAALAIIALIPIAASGGPAGFSPVAAGKRADSPEMTIADGSAPSSPPIDANRPSVRLTLAVIGDSDSHAYRDPLGVAADPATARGGERAATTLQWTEVLDRLRGPWIDQGPFEAVGWRGPIARLARLAGALVRQRKEDFRYNLAFNGAGCAGLLDDGAGQARVLERLIAADPARWRGPAAVVIRIGINDLGRVAQLEQFAATGLDAAAARRVDTCAGAVAGSIDLLRRRQPTLAILLVGVLDNLDWPRLHARWQDPAAVARVGAVLDAYDARLRALVAQLDRAMFIDDRAAFRRRFGGRDASGRPAYRSFSLGGAQALTMTEGDAPNHAVLADGHAGTAWNGLWAADLVTALNALFATAIPAITAAEIAVLADPDGRFGLAPPATARPDR